MPTFPATGAFAARSGSNASRGPEFEKWLGATKNLVGGEGSSVVSILGGAITPLTWRVAVDVEGGAAASDDLDRVNAGSEYHSGAVIVLSAAADTRTINVRNLTGNIVLKSSSFQLKGAWARLWLELQGTNWVELARDYGQDRAQERAFLGVDGAAPVAGQPATYSHATGAEALAGASQTAVMTPLTNTVAMQSAALMIMQHADATGLTAADEFLLARGGVLYRINIVELLAPSFANFATTGEIAITSANNGFAAHGMGAQPTLLRAYYRCKTAEHGYAVGMEVPVECTSPEETYRRVTFGADGTNYYFQMSATTNGVRGIHRTSGAAVNFTNANWRLFIRMWR
jgi:hypothetical protein